MPAGALLTVLVGDEGYFVKYELPLLMRPGYQLYVQTSSPPGTEETVRRLKPHVHVAQPSADLQEHSTDWNIHVAAALTTLTAAAERDGHTHALVVHPGCSWGAGTDPIEVARERGEAVVCANVRRGGLYADPWTLRTHSIFERDVLEARLRMGLAVSVRSAFGGVAVLALPAAFASMGEPPFWSACEGREVVVLPELRATQRLSTRR
jgi:hypothetical protein